MARLTADLSRIKQIPQRLLVLAVKFYRYFFKAWLGNACRFEPSCSQYALDALEKHGATIGASLAAARILRCHPWCEGGCDPVPHEPPTIFSRLGLVSDRSELRP